MAISAFTRATLAAGWQDVPSDRHFQIRDDAGAGRVVGSTCTDSLPAKLVKSYMYWHARTFIHTHTHMKFTNNATERNQNEL